MEIHYEPPTFSHPMLSTISLIFSILIFPYTLSPILSILPSLPFPLQPFPSICHLCPFSSSCPSLFHTLSSHPFHFLPFVPIESSVFIFALIKTTQAPKESFNQNVIILFHFFKVFSIEVLLP